MEIGGVELPAELVASFKDADDNYRRLYWGEELSGFDARGALERLIALRPAQHAEDAKHVHAEAAWKKQWEHCRQIEDWIDTAIAVFKIAKPDANLLPLYRSGEDCECRQADAVQVWRGVLRQRDIALAENLDRDLAHCGS